MPNYINREGRELYYNIEGTMSKKPILFLHGYLGSSNTHWGHQLSNQDLATKFQLIAPDLRGFGKSRDSNLEPVRLGRKWGEKHHSTDLLYDIDDLVNKELKLKQAPIAVGYSVGAALALEYGKRFPLSGLILLSPRPFLRATGKSYPYLSKEKRSTSRYMAFAWGLLKKFMRNLSKKDMINTSKNEKLIQEFALLNEIPTLIVYGLNDTVTPMVANEILKKYLPHAELKEFDGDHGINHENPDEFNKVVFEFCSKITFKNGNTTFTKRNLVIDKISS